MGKETGFDLARHWSRVEPRGLRVTGARTGIINERDAICATETERVVGFNAITLGAAFHGGEYRSLRAGERIKPGRKHQVTLRIDTGSRERGQ